MSYTWNDIVLSWNQYYEQEFFSRYSKFFHGTVSNLMHVTMNIYPSKNSRKILTNYRICINEIITKYY